MSGNVIDSLLVALGFQVDASELDEFKSKVKDARETMLSVVGAASAAAAGIGLFVAKVAEGLDDLGDFAEREQVAVEAIQELGHAAQLNGSSLQAVKSSIEGVNRVLGEAALGIGRGAMTFQKLGIEAKDAEGNVKSVDSLLSEVADRMQGMSRQESIAMAEKLGIDRSLIPLLMKGKAAIEEYRAEARALGIATEEDAQAAGEFQDSMDRTKFMLGALTRSIAIGLMPQVREVLDGFRKWVMANREIIRSSLATTLTLVSTIIGRLWQLVVGLVGGFIDLVKWLGQFKVVTYAAGAALALLIGNKVMVGVQALVTLIRAAAVAMAGFNARMFLLTGIVGAVLVGIGLLIEDFMTWKEGGDSVIGGLIAKFPVLGDVILAVQEIVQGLFGFLADIWNIVGPPVTHLIGAFWDLLSVIAEALWPVVKPVLMGFLIVLTMIVQALANVVKWATYAVAYVVGFFTDITASFVAGITGALQNVMAFLNKVAGAVQKVGGWLGLTDANVTATLNDSTTQGGRSSIPAAGVLGAAAGATTNTASNSTTNNVNAPITIVTNDPDRAGKSVREELNRVNRQATRNGTSAVQL